jgi:hypothetical protein
MQKYGKCDIFSAVKLSVSPEADLAAEENVTS